MADKHVDKHVDEGKGRVKEAVGSLTGNASLKRKGQSDQDKASVKKAVDKTAGKAKDVKDALTGD